MVHYPSWNKRLELKLSLWRKHLTIATTRMCAKLWQKSTSLGFVIRCSQIHIILLTPKFEPSKSLLTSPLCNEETTFRMNLYDSSLILWWIWLLNTPIGLTCNLSLCKRVYVLPHFDLVRPIFGKVIDIVSMEVFMDAKDNHLLNSYYISYEILAQHKCAKCSYWGQIIPHQWTVAEFVIIVRLWVCMSVVVVVGVQLSHVRQFTFWNHAALGPAESRKKRGISNVEVRA